MKNISEDQVKAPEEKKHTPEQAADQRPFTAAVITLSDKGAKGQRVDESGPAAVQMLEEAGYEVREAFVLPDEPELLEKELRTTSQRVNLFAKVKIPEAKENIRVIQVYLGDQQTAAVVRGKISKKKLVEV